MTTQIKQVSLEPHKRLWGEFLIIFPHIWFWICPTQAPQIRSKWKGWNRQWTYSPKKLFGAPPASFSPASPSSKNGHTPDSHDSHADRLDPRVRVLLYPWTRHAALHTGRTRLLFRCPICFRSLFSLSFSPSFPPFFQKEKCVFF